MKAKAMQAEADWKRAQQLGRSEALSSSLYDSYKANSEVAKANIEAAEGALAQAKATTIQAKATLEKAQRNLAFCTIVSPVNGVIIDRRVNIGQTVVSSLNTPSLFLIAKDLTRMQIWVSVNEADVGRITPGAPVTFACDAFPGRQFTGCVGKVRLNASMTQNVVMYTVEVNTENPDKVLLPYLTANVQFIVQKATDTLMVPTAALRWIPSSPAEITPDARDKAAGKPGTCVWVLDGQYVRPVSVNAGVTDGVNTAVTADDLHEGKTIVTGEEVHAAQSDTVNPFLPKALKR
jgi:HlyD family secretion protein